MNVQRSGTVVTYDITGLTQRQVDVLAALVGRTSSFDMIDIGCSELYTVLSKVREERLHVNYDMCIRISE